MSDIEFRITEAWKDYYSKPEMSAKPDFLCLSAQDHYALSKSLNSDKLITNWNGVKILISLTDANKVFFLRK